jgi:hypothetical protein
MGWSVGVQKLLIIEDNHFAIHRQLTIVIEIMFVTEYDSEIYSNIFCNMSILE